MEQTSTGQVPLAHQKTDRKLWQFIVFTPLTFSIYTIVAFSKISTEINNVASRYDGKHTMHYCIVFFLLTGITLGIFPLIWWTKLSNRIGAELKRRGINQEFSGCTFWGWNVLGSLILVGPFIYIHRLYKSMNLLNEDYNAKG